jgi:restriction endonuclease S subunit
MTPQRYGYWVGFRRMPAEDVPTGWRQRPLSEMARFRGGGTLGLTMSDYVQEGFDAYSAEGQNGKSRIAEFDGPAVIVSSIGARCGKCFYASGKFTTLANVQIIFPDPEELDAYFLWNLVNDERFWPRYQTAQPFIRPSGIRQAWIPTPPINEQRAIADILDAVDTAMERTSSAIVSARCLELGLLEDLVTKQARLWPVQRLDAVAEVGSGVTLGRDLSGGPVVNLPYLRVENVQAGFIDLTEIKKVDVRPDEVGRYLLQAGDVLMTEGGDFDKLGRGGVWHGELTPCLHQNHVFRVRPNSSALDSDFLEALICSNYGKRFFQRIAKRTTNLASINKTQLRAFRVPCPPVVEQRRISAVLKAASAQVAAITKKLAVLERLKRGLMQDLLTGKKRLIHSAPI